MSTHQFYHLIFFLYLADLQKKKGKKIYSRNWVKLTINAIM